MLLIALVPRIIALLTDEPTAVVGHVEAQRHEAAGRCAGGVVPGVDDAGGDVVHARAFPCARMKEPEGCDRDGGRDGVEAVDVDEESGHGEGVFGDGGGRWEAGGYVVWHGGDV